MSVTSTGPQAVRRGPSSSATRTRRSGMRHTPRVSRTATAVLRAIPTGQMPALLPPSQPGARRTSIAAEHPAANRAGTSAASATAAPLPSAAEAEQPRTEGLRGLKLRDLAASGGAAALTWTIALHLGLLGTALGTFVVSVGSAIVMALVADSATGLRRVLLRWVRRLRWSRQSTSRRR